MSFITRNHNQTIVYWSTPATDKYGARTFTAPVEISGRWEDHQQLFIDVAGREKVSNAVIYLGLDVNIGGYLYLGELSDIASSIDETNPKNVSGSYEIRAFKKIPNIKGDDYERMVIV